MSKPQTPDNPAERGPETRTDGKEGTVRTRQREGNRRPDPDLPRGSEPSTRGASQGQR
ncbi:hypothetical protein ACLBKU_10810 [Erythrobacter sp. NE805]|uniref:hypothetical protein n=1 Tax=Erythrobacter sp. NE805 TaxID=3389875 RepID=UPI00396AFE16